MNWINILHTYGAHYVNLLFDMRAHFYQEEQAIQTLLEGYLPPEELTNTLQGIADLLLKSGGFKICHEDIGYYYHLNDITYQRIDNKPFIKIKIPLTATTTLFQLYRINTVPIPLAADRHEHSLFDIPKPYIAISYNRLFYVSLTKK